jgi:hypothetical protein
MTRTPFDQFCKRLLEEFLSPFGEVQLNLEVPGESRFVDVWFMPAAQADIDPSSLGLLGNMAATPCLIEPFRNPPTATEIRNCLLKLFLVQADFQRKARREDERLVEAALPQLWILTASASAAQLTGLGATLDAAWLPSVFFLPSLLRTAVIVLNQLPQTPETLWLRLLGKGATQQQAIQEVLALPRDSPQRAIALRLLVGWKLTIETSGEIYEEDREVVMSLAQVYQALLEQEREAERRGLERGIQEGELSLVLRLLPRRVGTIPEALQATIQALPLAKLEALGEALLDFTQLEDLENWLQAQGIEEA